MFAVDDAIVAIATPPGRSGIGIVRISGPGSREIAGQILSLRSPLVPRYATFARTRSALDETVSTYFPAPHSYTGQDVVEIGAHGNPIVLETLVRAAIDAGARLARPGEFTLRAFLNGKKDLVQAEAVGDLIAAATPLQARVAFDQLEGTLTTRIGEVDAILFDLIARLEASLDFPDEGYHFVEPRAAETEIGRIVEKVGLLLDDAPRGRMIRDGALVVMVGRPNTGKSSVFNRLTGSDRAIVTDVPGTTRDMITERVNIEGLAVSVVDTAGWRETNDVVEREGVARSERAREVAALLVLVIDQNQSLTGEDRRVLEESRSRPRLLLLNKSDLEPAITPDDLAAEASASGDEIIAVSAKTGDGFDRLRREVVTRLTGTEVLRDPPSLSNTRHIQLLEDARTYLLNAQQSARDAAPEEFLLTHLQAARARFDEIVGTRTSEDVLTHIFEKFCIGK